jgi:hypothetical protein
MEKADVALLTQKPYAYPLVTAIDDLVNVGKSIGELSR